MNNKIFAKLFALIGILFIINAIFLIKERNSAVSANNVVIDQNSETTQPITISIESLGLSLPISPAKPHNGKWPAEKDSVSYWVESPLPGEAGNSVIYGHNFPNLFGKLKNIKPNSIVTINFNNGDQRHFKVVQTITITPDQTHILEPTTDSRLTIYTCTGFLDSKRFVVIATPADAVTKADDPSVKL